MKYQGGKGSWIYIVHPATYEDCVFQQDITGKIQAESNGLEVAPELFSTWDLDFSRE